MTTQDDTSGFYVYAYNIFHDFEKTSQYIFH